MKITLNDERNAREWGLIMLIPASRKFWLHALFLKSVLMLIFCSAPLSYGDSLESSWAVDGKGRVKWTALLRLRGYASGMNFQVRPDASIQGMGGLHGSWLAIGRLEARGFLAELVQPQQKHLGRSSETSGFRANLRSLSSDQFGVALFLPHERLGGALELWEDGGRAWLWAQPFQWEGGRMDFAGVLGSRESVLAGERWYPDLMEIPEGWHGVVGLRLRQKWGSFHGSSTAMLSGGAFSPVAGALSLSGEWSDGPWRWRGRGGWRAPSFRDARGRVVKEQFFVAWDWRYRPQRGFQMTLDHQYDHAEPHAGDVRGEWGWRWENWQATAGCSLKNLGAAKSWDWFGLHYVTGRLLREGRFRWALYGKWSPHKDTFLRLSMDHYRSQGWSGDVAVMMTIQKAKSRFGVGGTLRWLGKGHRIFIDIILQDLPRDWIPHPQSAGDFELSLRWIQEIS